MLTIPTISYLTDIYFDFGALKLLPDLLKKYRILNPLIITDKGLVNLGIIEKLNIGFPIVYDDVETNPTEAMVLNALQVYRGSGCDGIIAVGGGSPIDLAKCTGILVNHPLPLEQYAILREGISKITSAFPPFIAIPTTSGSGSEAGRAALVTIAGVGKLGFLSKYLLPVATICDPELTFELPSILTAATGMDAISHCVETFCSPRYNPVADAIALDGLKRGYTNITKATFNGFDRQARSEMMMCSLQGGLAFQKGLGAVHSLSHPLGALTERRLHHGTLNAIFLPVVLQFNYDFCREKMRAIADRLEIQNATELTGRFAQLNHDIGLPSRLRELGLTKEDLKPLAQNAKEDHCSSTNPRSLEVKDCYEMYLQAW
ncbi:MAG: iron-containing alcohol dehydrogenase [Ferruginibacter sp.]